MRGFKIIKNITNRESEIVDKYLNEISKIDMISAEEEVTLAQRIKAGDEKALEKLTGANLRFVVSVAKQYQYQWLSLPDLINEGNLGLIRAAKKFDETRGFKFISYAVWRIRQSILQALAEQSRLVRLPLNQIGNITRINKEFSRLEQKFNREPTEQELAETLDITIKKIKMSAENDGRHSSLDKYFNNNPDEWSLGDNIKASETTASDRSLYEESLAIEIARALSTIKRKEATIVRLYFWIAQNRKLTQEEISEVFQIAIETVREVIENAKERLGQVDDTGDFEEKIENILAPLSPRDATILRLYFWIPQNHQLTLEEIAVIFDLTRERVRQIKEKAIRRLKSKGRSKYLQEYL